MLALESYSLLAVVGIFLAAAVAIVVIGTRFTGTVDELADRTGIGEALAGALFLGATTSLPDIVVSITAATHGRADFAMSNAVGGIAVQTAFLALADLSYRKANLEHAAASLTNLIEAVLLISLLTLPLLAMLAPGSVWGPAHPISYLMPIVYIGGLKLAKRQDGVASWVPGKTAETVPDKPQKQSSTSTTRLWVRFALGAASVAMAGYLIARSGEAIADRTVLSEHAVGAVFTGVATSSGELVTSLAAVRRGALTLAVAGIIGGNTFDTLLIAISDFAYTEGSLFHAVEAQSGMLALMTILMTAVLLMGLLVRQKHGMANIGFESVLILLLYGGAVAMVFAL